MHATDLVGINGITRVLLVYTCQQGVYPRGHYGKLRTLFSIVTSFTMVSVVKQWVQLCDVLFNVYDYHGYQSYPFISQG
jgi:hypothetical protein